ncbi:neuron-specific vesicular protein calcyon isoform X1 [Natator depressus]|uniref:neuron-specific vesicular protein calcyon isoform X1 n=1 Tax=Natator depressus TaxID=27790 RepID=UPI003EBE26C8
MSVVTQRLHLGQVFPAGTVREQTCLMPKQLITLGSFPREVTIGPISYQQCYLTMVKLGSNLCEKPDKEQGAGSSDDSFDNIPLITPLDVNQLQQPFPDKVIVKTRTEYQLQQKKKRKLHVPGIKKLNINLYDEVSEKVKLTGLILITVAFLACLLMLVMYKALWYDQLSCPEGFVFKHKHCTPAALEMYYSEQEVGPQGSLYTAINHLNQGKKTIPELPSPWLPVINALKEGEKGKEDPAGIQQ